MGIVHHSNHVRFFELGRVAWLTEHDQPYEAYVAQGVHFATTHVEVDYHRPARFADVVEITVWAEAVRGASLRIAYVLRVEGEAAATGAAEQCQMVDVDFIPAELTRPHAGPAKLPLQIVAWIEDPDAERPAERLVEAALGAGRPQALEDRVAEPGPVHDGGDRRHPDDQQRGHPDAGDDDRPGQRQLDAAQALFARSVELAPRTAEFRTTFGLLLAARGADAPGRFERMVLSNTSSYFPDKKGWNDRLGLVRERGVPAFAAANMERWFTKGFRERDPAATVPPPLQ